MTMLYINWAIIGCSDPELKAALATALPLQYHPSKHKTFVLHLYNVGPTSSTLNQLCTNVVQMFYSGRLPSIYIEQQPGC